MTLTYLFDTLEGGESLSEYFKKKKKSSRELITSTKCFFYVYSGLICLLPICQKARRALLTHVALLSLYTARVCRVYVYFFKEFIINSTECDHLFLTNSVDDLSEVFYLFFLLLYVLCPLNTLSDLVLACCDKCTRFCTLPRYSAQRAYFFLRSAARIFAVLSFIQ